MKKVLLIAVAALFAASAAQSQDVYKQTGGEKNLEVLFAPLGGSPIGINGIKFRTFTSATTAIRGEVFLGFNSSADKRLETDSEGDEQELKDSESAFDISVNIGIENHFAGTDRLSPYVGVVGIVGFSNSTEKSEFLSGTDIEEGTTKNGSLSFGANAVAGCDFYFADNIYIGAELGFGALFTTEFDTKQESTVEGSETIETPNGNSFSIGPNVVGA
ncbi:MAG: hypothetical protein ABR574_13040, partial [Cryomorphaceae bacterium]